MKQRIILCALLISLMSCKPTLNYIGNTFAPTTNVEIFFSESDIIKEYAIMGKMRNSGNEHEIDQAEKVQAVMIEKARSVGADAIIFHGMYQEKVLGETTDSSTTQEENNEYSTTDTSIRTAKIYEVTLIKYK